MSVEILNNEDLGGKQKIIRYFGIIFMVLYLIIFSHLYDFKGIGENVLDVVTFSPSTHWVTSNGSCIRNESPFGCQGISYGVSSNGSRIILILLLMGLTIHGGMNRLKGIIQISKVYVLGFVLFFILDPFINITHNTIIYYLIASPIVLIGIHRYFSENTYGFIKNNHILTGVLAGMICTIFITKIISQIIKLRSQDFIFGIPSGVLGISILFIIIGIGLFINWRYIKNKQNTLSHH